MQQDLFDIISEDSGFRSPEQADDTILVVGVGGGGGNAIDHIYEQKVPGVKLALVNTDRRQLERSKVTTKVVIGNGLGAGDKPNVATKAAENSTDDLAKLFSGSISMAFITAGMGGGTGTGAAPIVARVAREHGVLTVGIVTIPFAFEGARKINKALAGAAEMSHHTDALIVINNQRLVDNYPDTPMARCFELADNTLCQAALSISELVSKTGYWNVDFNDVHTILANSGAAIISSGIGEGPERVTKALVEAISSPLLRNRDVFASTRMLVTVYCNPDSQKPLLASELNEIHRFVEQFRPDLRIITGWYYDNSLADEVKITVLAAGFELDLGQENRLTAVDPAEKAAGYRLLSNDQIHDDDDLDEFESTPALMRQRPIDFTTPDNDNE